MITEGCHHPIEKQPNKRWTKHKTFSKEDNEGVLFPYNDAIVVTLNMENYDVCHILIDNESLADIFYLDALMKIEISLDRLTQVDSPLVRFIGDAIQVEGMISLIMRMECYPLWSIAQVDFCIVRTSLAYNAIFGWLGLNIFWVVVSTYYLKIKFLTIHGIGKIHGDQSLACHYYPIELQGNKTADAYLIEGLDTCDDLVEQWGELAEDLIPIPLADGNPEHVVWIGSNLDE